jgi:hypothetical protein
MIKCIDALGFFHPKFPWKLLIEELPGGWGIRVLDDPKCFGSDHRRLEQFLIARPDTKLVGFHRHWDAAHNTKEAICPIKKLRNILPAYQEFALAYPPKRTVLVSHSLEYNCSNKIKVNARIKAILELAPACKIAQSCMKGYYDPAYMREKHGDAVADVVSSDGIDIWDLNVPAWLNKNKNSFAACAWFHSCNGRKKGEAPKPYKLRNNWPTKAELRRAFTLMGD